MTTEPSDSAERDQEWSAVLVACLEALQSDRRPSEQELIARYPEFALELANYLAHRDQFDRLATPLRLVAQAARIDTPFPRQSLTLGADKDAALDAEAETKGFGDYELLEQLGQGGMGVVYKARHLGLNRLVALKMISTQGLKSASDVQRLRNEAETVAQLDHPNIVPIYEVGEREGRPYFSMKLIDGGSLDNQLTRFSAEPRAGAHLLAVVARAVHHGHQRGILHRDLKPSNILLDADGQPHITDFGLAKRVEGDSNLTQSGALVGTPSYMSPEQASGQKAAITTATDVYGLGAILYALLTEQPPFRGDTPLDTLGQVKERSPEPPRRTNPLVERDLETICLKCLNKDPQRRYRSAEAMAEDLERWLAGKSIQARAAGKAEHLWRWCRRNRALASAVMLAAGGLLATTVIATIFAFREGAHAELLGKEKKQTEQALAQAEGETRMAEANEAKAQAQRRRAETSFRKSLNAVVDLLMQLDRTELVKTKDIAAVRRVLLARVLLFFAGFSDAKSPDPSDRLEVGLAYLYTAKVLRIEGENEQASAAFEKATARLEALADDYPTEVVHRQELAQSQMMHGNLLSDLGRPEPARDQYHKAFDNYWLAVKLDPDEPRGLNYLAWNLANCQDVQSRDPDRAVQLAKKCVALRPDVASFWNTLGVASYRAKNWTAASQALEEDVKRRTDPDWADWFFLAMTQWQMGDRERAHKTYNQAAQWMDKNRPDDDELRRYRSEAASLLGIKEQPPPYEKEKP